MIENIKFTKKEERDKQLAFFDVLLTRTNDGNYREKTQTQTNSTLYNNQPIPNTK